MISDLKKDRFLDSINTDISIKEFRKVSNLGLNALRLYKYIRVLQRLYYPNNKTNHQLPVKIDNKELYKLFGVGPNQKWIALNKLKKNNIIKLILGGKGRSPSVIILQQKLKDE